MKKNTDIYRTDWNLLEIQYEPRWMPAHVTGEDLAQIQVRSIYPTDAPLPIAKTGFYTNTLPASTIRAAGGPVAFIDVMLAAEALHPYSPNLPRPITLAPHRSQFLSQFCAPFFVPPRPLSCFVWDCCAMPGRGLPRSGSRAQRPRQSRPVTPAASSRPLGASPSGTSPSPPVVLH